jgi:glycosyltransferase involved in cell wall biosynthesis
MKIMATGMEWVDHIPGGLNQYFADYLKAMHQYGHSVEGLLSGEGQARLNAPEYIQDVIPGSLNINTFNRVKSFYHAVKSRSSQFKPDVFNPHFALYASLATRKIIPGHIPIVTHFQGPWSYESKFEDQGNPLKKYVSFQVKKAIEQMVYRRSDAFIVLSSYFQHVLVNDFGVPKERIHVIPAATNTDRFQPAADRKAVRSELGVGAGAKVLFCARRLVRRMGIDLLIRAMLPVAQQVPDTVLYVAGEGPLQPELERLIDELQLRGRVRLLGRVSAENLVKWYQAADLSIVPTITLEGFGLVTTEALACGTPVLGTPFGGTREILENISEQLLFRDKEPQAMADKIISVLQGDCVIPSREECREYVLRNYTWAEVSKSVTKVFGQAIEERKEQMTYENRVL